MALKRPTGASRKGVTENTGPKQRGRPFRKGVSGNPAGKPPGARHKTTLAAEALLDGEAEKLTRKAIDLALAGDGVALKLCLDRIVPPRRSRIVQIELPRIETPADIVTALGAVAQAMAEGQIAPDDAQAIAAVIEAKRRAIETAELEARIAALEGSRNAGA